jgi:hypothetical protein
MARYYIETAHFLDKIWYPAGATIDWDGPPSEHMIPIEQWEARRENRAGSENRGQVVSNPNASPPVITANTQPAKVAMAGPEEPAEAVALPNDERNPDFVRPNLSKPIAPGADEAAQSAPAKQSRKRSTSAAPKSKGKAK